MRREPKLSEFALARRPAPGDRKLRMYPALQGVFPGASLRVELNLPLCACRGGKFDIIIGHFAMLRIVSVKEVGFGHQV